MEFQAFFAGMPGFGILRVLGHANTSLNGGNDEGGRPVRVDIGSNLSQLLTLPQGPGEGLLPELEDPVQAFPEALIDGGHLLGQIVQWASQFTGPNREIALHGLIDGGECLQGGFSPFDRPDPDSVNQRLDDLLHHRMAEGGFVGEVVIKGPFGHPGLGQDAVQAGGAKAVAVNLPVSGLDQFLPGLVGVFPGPRPFHTD